MVIRVTTTSISGAYSDIYIALYLHWARSAVAMASLRWLGSRRLLGRKFTVLWLCFVLYAAIILALLVWVIARRSFDAGPLAISLLPRYLDDAQINRLRINQDGPLSDQLKQAFDKADADSDGYLTQQELQDWLCLKVSEHVTVGVKNNLKEFVAADKNPRNGWIEWGEYVVRYRKALGVTSDAQMTRGQKERQMKLMSEFYETAVTSDDSYQLTVDEFLRFQHPEASHTRMLERITELIDPLDQDGDSMISIDELSQLSDPSYRPSADEAALFPVHSSDEMVQLHSLLDTDANGLLTQRELMVFLDVRHIIHSARDARRLLRLADSDSDSRLTRQEVLTHSQQFRQMVDAKYKLHPDDAL